MLQSGAGLVRVRRLIDQAAEWLRGDRETAPGIWLEKQVFLLRWLGIIAIMPVVLDQPEGQRATLLAIVGFAAGYNALVPWLVRHRPERALAVTLGGDTASAGLFLCIVGFDSPLYMVLYTIVVAAALRVGLRPALRLVGFLILLDGGSGLARGDLQVGALLFRSTFLTLVALLAALLFHYVQRGEGRLRRLNARLHQANRELRQLDEAKSAFLSNVSHELRTPLAAIRAYAELLLTYDDPAVTREFVEIIHAESERLTVLVSDILDLMKIEAGKMEYRLEPLDLAPLIDEVVRTYAPLLTRQNVAFRCVLPPGLPRVDADPARLRQVLGNLLSNAHKFTARGTIALSARPLGDEVQVAVSDTGVGIAAEDQARIFERFQQAGPVLTDKPRGSGLGLAICRDIVAHHGGRIWVESEPGVGSTFTFSLRVCPAVARDAPGDEVGEPQESVPASCASWLVAAASKSWPQGAERRHPDGDREPAVGAGAR